MPYLELKNVSFAYPNGYTAVEDVSMAFDEGESVAIIGQNGAGKTTLIKILTGQLKPTGGSATVLGRDSCGLGAAEHGKMGVMMDCFGLYERLSAYDNLAFYADIYGVPRGRIADILKRIGLYEARKTAVAKLSKGMKNRLSLARALLNQARLLFLDEPTSGLDPLTAKEIHRLLKEEQKRGTTIFLTTHNMFEAQSLCAHVALLSEGRILERGKPADICRKYNHLNQLTVTLQDGRRLLLENGGASGALLKEWLEKGLLASIHSTEPTLEGVFIELTGKGLYGI